MLIRMKFKISDLVNEILDKLPKEVWISKTTTFFDPSIGGWQFVREIERRLRKAGHNDKNISNRVFGFALDKLELKYALDENNKDRRLIGKYIAGNYNTELNMKFDIIVGNQAYQQWMHMKFLEKCFDILKHDGELLFVQPSTNFISLKPVNQAHNKITNKIEKHIKSIELINGNSFGLEKT